jgi:hypothetical protein
VLKVVEKRDEREAGEELLGLDELAREGAGRMLSEALKAEVDDYVERHRRERDAQGHALVVRNGHAPTRKVTLGAGTVELNAPRVNDCRLDESGRRQRFTSHILPPYMRRSPKAAEVLQILYLRGLSTGDFRSALVAASMMVGAVYLVVEASGHFVMAFVLVVGAVALIELSALVHNRMAWSLTSDRLIERRDLFKTSRREMEFAYMR